MKAIVLLFIMMAANAGVAKAAICDCGAPPSCGSSRPPGCIRNSLATRIYQSVDAQGAEEETVTFLRNGELTHTGQLLGSLMGKLVFHFHGNTEGTISRYTSHGDVFPYAQVYFSDSFEVMYLNSREFRLSGYSE